MKRVSRKYHSIAPVSIRSDRQYQEYLAVLENRMLHPSTNPGEREYTSTLINRIRAYESANYKIPDAAAHEVLQSLMEAHGETRKDLEKIFATRSAVSEALSGSRPFGRARIEQLAEHYQVSPAVFYPRPATTTSKMHGRITRTSDRPAFRESTWASSPPRPAQTRRSNQAK